MLCYSLFSKVSKAKKYSSVRFFKVVNDVLIKCPQGCPHVFLDWSGFQRKIVPMNVPFFLNILCIFKIVLKKTGIQRLSITDKCFRQSQLSFRICFATGRALVKPHPQAEEICRVFRCVIQQVLAWRISSRQRYNKISAKANDETPTDFGCSVAG